VLQAWHPWVTASRLEPAAGGVGRRVTIVGGAAGHRELTERLVSFDAAAREYAYMIVAGPVPFADYLGRFRVIPGAPGTCAFEFHARFRPAPGKTEAEAAERVRTFYEAGLENLPALFDARSQASAPGDARRRSPSPRPSAPPTTPVLQSAHAGQAPPHRAAL